ncbi:MAG: succinylglutamate-semialdehyde dehydrogenase [Mariniblastus sp.]|nr:succinylglutamate-semialdehyde dehydrogenase [Mariniblastus sp.]
MTETPNRSIRTLQDQGQLIGGQWQSSGESELVSDCPVDQSVVWQGHVASRGQLDEAFHSARRAVGSWSRRPVAERIAYTEAFAERVKSCGDELAELISAETGKPLWESKTEVAACVGKISVSIDSFRQRRDQSSFEMGELQAVTRFKPFGVMAVLGPFNFPAHLPNGHIVPALIAGNTIVFKPSELTPAVGQWMAEKWCEAGLPEGVLNLVQGGREVGAGLASHHELDGLLFTGSSAAGKALHEAFGKHPQKMLALEMGGNNPLIVHEVEDLEAAAYLSVLSAYITAGQRCTCARRLIVVDGPECDAFMAELIRMIGRLKIGKFTESVEPFAGTVITAEQGGKLVNAFQQLVEDGARPLVSLSSLDDCEALLSPGLLDVTELENRSDEELFGPLLNLIRVPDFGSAIAEANQTEYGLSAGLLSDRQTNFDQFISEIRAGIVNWNRQTTGATGKMPFGGCGLSGNNRPSAYFAADYCSFPTASLESKRLEMPAQLMTGIESESDA